MPVSLPAQLLRLLCREGGRLNGDRRPQPVRCHQHRQPERRKEAGPPEERDEARGGELVFSQGTTCFFPVFLFLSVFFVLLPHNPFFFYHSMFFF